MTQSPEISGGGGFTFEDAPVAIYLGALLGEELPLAFTTASSCESLYNRPPTASRLTI